MCYHADESAGKVAKEFFEFGIYGARGEHIVTLRIRRWPGWTDEDMVQFQNFLWTQVGLAIRDSEDLQRTLQHGGVEIVLDRPDGPSPAEVR